MENKNEKSMTLEEMISEMLKDAKVVKVPLPAKASEKTEAQKQDKPMPARPSGVPFLSLNIKNLHLHMDERMTSYNYGFLYKIQLHSCYVLHELKRRKANKRI